MKKFILSCFAMLCMMFALAPPVMALQSHSSTAMHFVPAAGIDHVVVADTQAIPASVVSFKFDGVIPSAAELAERMCTSPLMTRYVNLFPSDALMREHARDPSVHDDPGIYRRMAAQTGRA